MSIKKARKKGLLYQGAPLVIGPEHREQSCAGKVRYKFGVHALPEAMRLLEGNSSIGPITLYRCGYCGGWHLGKAAKTIMARLRVVAHAD